MVSCVYDITRCHLGCTPRLRHRVKAQPHRVEKSSCLRLIVASESAAVGEAEAGSGGDQPARNSQPGTHQDDEIGSDWCKRWSVAPSSSKAHRIERFPYASENSCLATNSARSATEESARTRLEGDTPGPSASAPDCRRFQ